MNTIAPTTELLPTAPTIRDFRRLGAIVTMARYRIDPACVWNQEDVSEQLWENQDGLPFRDLARVAMRAARYAGIKSPAGVGHFVAGITR